MPFYTDVYLQDTMFLELDEQGAYTRLLCYMWANKSTLPNDEKQLAKLCGVHVNKFRVLWVKLEGFFIDTEDGFITQKRLHHEYYKAEHKRKVCSDNAYRRWNGKGA